MTEPRPRTLARYFSGECTSHEQRRIEAWLERSPTNRRILEQHKTLWDLSAHVPENADVVGREVSEDWERIRAAIEDSNRSKYRLDRGPVAHRQRRKRSYRWVALAAAAVLIVGGSWFAGSILRSEDTRTAGIREFSTLAGQRARVPLGDGTYVRLNVASKIRFPEAFTNGKREVYLEGEAFFEVSEDSTRPFIVHASDAVVQVLGTAFNVRAYEDDHKVDVFVSRGKVALQHTESGNDTGLILTSEQLGRLAGQRLERMAGKGDVNRHLAWMEERLVFEDTRLGDVAAELERWYRLTVQIQNPPIAEWRLTASFKHESIDEILNVIATSAGVRYTRDRENVTFYQ